MADAHILDQLVNLTPSAALVIVIVVAGVTVTLVGAALVLAQRFCRLTHAQRRDIIKLAAALRRTVDRDQ